MPKNSKNLLNLSSFGFLWLTCKCLVCWMILYIKKRERNVHKLLKILREHEKIYLLIDWGLICWHAFLLLHLHTVGSEKFSRELVTIGNAIPNAIQIDISANIEVLPCIEDTRRWIFCNFRASQELSLRQAAVLQRKRKFTFKNMIWSVRHKKHKLAYLYVRLNNFHRVIFQVIKYVDISNAIMLGARLGHVLTKVTHEFESLLIINHIMRAEWLHLLLLRAPVSQCRIIAVKLLDEYFIE